MSTLVSQQYDELLHYTTLSGLEGILSSDSVWATDAEFLNDSSEVIHFFDTRLPELVSPEVRTYTIEAARESEKLASIVQEGGFDRVIAAHTSRVVSTLRNATLAFNRPFILSLSGPGDANVRRSGLLSQWRGYGNDGGYALVFDTQRLEELLALEARTHRYINVQIGDIYYQGIAPALQSAAPDVEEYEAVVKLAVSRLVRGGSGAETDGFYEALTGLSCRCKHWGFWEEREIRAIALVARPDFSEAVTDQSLSAKEIGTFSRGEQHVPFIALFASLAHKLPLKRIIVGPHKARETHAQQVRGLLRRYGYSIDVLQSEIPYIGK